MAAQPQTFLLKDPFSGISRSSSWSTIASSNSHQHKKPNNPSRQRPALGKQQDEIPSLRKKTPVRAVFDDLLTAHSSITSRKTNTRVKNGVEGFQGEDSLRLEVPNVAKCNTDFLGNVPLPSLHFYTAGPGQLVANNQADNLNYPQFHTQPCQSVQSVAFGSPACMCTSMQTAFTAGSPHLTRNDPCGALTTSLWHRDSLDLDDTLQRRSLKATQSNCNQECISRPFQLDEYLRGSKQPNSEPQVAGELFYHSRLSTALSGTKKYPIDLSMMPSHPKTIPLGHVSDIRLVSDDGSPGEGSTVGNIYNHYIQSDEVGGTINRENISDVGQYDRRSTSSGAIYRAWALKLSLNNSPNGQARSSAIARSQSRRNRLRSRSRELRLLFSPPKSTDFKDQDCIPGSRRSLTDLPSCGDTGDLRFRWSACPVDAKPPIIRVDGQHVLSSGFLASDEELLLPNTSNGHNLRGSSYLSRGQIPSVADRDPISNGLKVGLPGPGRLPLEREVSEALRRASGLSAYSNGTVSSSALEHYTNFGVISKYQSVGMRRDPKGSSHFVSGTMSEGSRAMAEQAKAFYDQDAIALQRLTTHEQNIVRVPIMHNKAESDTTSTLPTLNALLRGRPRQATPEDDHNDWETVGESGFGLDNRSAKNMGLIGGTINRTGSSVANTSDEGTASSCVPEIQDFGSTERIAQHPGHIQYFGDYRQRDLKKIHIPVFLPVFREHKVNGYLADSTRFRPPPPSFHTGPPQLPKMHANPFRSSPPKVIPVKRLSKREHYMSHFQYSRGTLSIEQESGRGSGSVKSHTRHWRPQQDWMESFGVPGPAISNRHHNLQIPGPKRPSSWRYVMGLASQRELNSNENKDGDGNNCSFIVDNSSQSGLSDAQFHRKKNKRERILVDETVQNTTLGERRITSNSHRRAPLVKGLPGAFYKGLQAQAGELKQKGRSEPGRVILNAQNSRPILRDYPTNTLRPLSLLRDNRPCTPIVSTEQHPNKEAVEDDFIYRSPLAPPKRDSWKQLYSTQQMQGILDAAKADLVVESQIQPAAGFSQSVSAKVNGSHKHLFETPTLRLWRRDESTRTDLKNQKTKFSIIVLCFCTAFPPMLMLYAWGRLDGIIHWLTDGAYSSFASRQKKWAILLICCWGVAVFLGLITFLVYWFAGLHSK